MKPILLALALAYTPFVVVSSLTFNPGNAVAATSTLGDTSALEAIAADTLTIAKSGDLVAAQQRITDFEATWDAAESIMRPMDIGAWTKVDHAADSAIEALRADPATADEVVPALDNLIAVLGNPATPNSVAVAADAKPVFSLTNADGSPVPCETALEEVRRASSTRTISADDKAKFDELQTKGIERCNADDDKRADGLFGQALDVLNK
jgi:hypothetical protein